MDPLEKEYERIRKLLETIDVSSDEADDESNSGEEDNLEVGHESTDTEQEMSDVASENELDTDCSDYYTGKDGETEWRTRKFRANVRTRAHNIITETTCVKGSAKNAKSPMDCWSCFVDGSIMNILVECTNRYINENKASCSRNRDAKNTSKEEVSTLIGLLYLAGVTRVEDKILKICGLKMEQELIYFILLCHYGSSNSFSSASGSTIKLQEVKG